MTGSTTTALHATASTTRPRAWLAIGVMMTMVAMLLVGQTTPAAAVSAEHDRVVSDDPANWTPHVLDGNVQGIVQVGDQMIVAGKFTQVRQADNNTVLARSNIFAFDATTGQINTNFRPTFDGIINGLAPGTDGRSVFVAGNFKTVNGVASQSLIKLDTVTGQVVTQWDAETNGRAKDVIVRGNTVYVAGGFGFVNGERRANLAALDVTTGALRSNVNLAFSDVHNGGTTFIRKIDISPDGSRLVAIGNFKTVNNQLRDQIAMVDLTTSPASLSTWYTNLYGQVCSSSFDTYMRDVEYAPDGSYFVIVTTGAFSGGAGSGTLCDTSARWEAGRSGLGQQPTWVDYTGGDTLYSVAVTGAAVYTGGHQRWHNNPYARDAEGPGAVAREGISALDTVNGVPLSWDPGRDRGVGVFDLYATATTSAGLWVGSDTDRIGRYEYHGRLAFFPLAGGTKVPSTPDATLPNDLFLAPAGGDGLARRSFDGNAAGAPSPVSGTASWSSARGAFMLNGTVYSGWADGKVYARTFDGTSFGTARALNLYRLTTGAPSLFPVSQITGMFFHDGSLYYTVAGQTNLYRRGFAVESEIVGGQQFTTASSGVNWGQVRGMTLAGGTLYYGSSTDGALRAIDFANGSTSGTSRVVQSSGGGSGESFDTSAMFVFHDGTGSTAPPPPPPANEAPSASFTATCGGLTCSFDGSGSTDDGSIASYAWSFGDGASASGVTTSHSYGSAGTYSVTLTVTDDAGSTDTASRQVTAEADTAISLNATAEKRKGQHRTTLQWSGATTSQVDVYRDGSRLVTTANNGSYVDQTSNKGAATYVYQVCEASSTTCSRAVTVTY